MDDVAAPDRGFEQLVAFSLVLGKTRLKNGLSISARRSRENLAASWSLYEQQIIRLPGLRPRRQAGKATETMNDFRLLGGRFKINRRLASPLTICCMWKQIASTCQFGISCWPGFRTLNAA